MRRTLGLVIGAVVALVLSACGSSSPDTATASGTAAADAPLRVGVSPVPHAQILKYVADNLAATRGLKLEIVEFSDYVQPNLQLQDGRLDANYFQHKPYLDDFNASKGTKLSFVAPVHLEPLGLYSRKVKDLASLPQGGTVAVPNDATNLGRALGLLADNGVVTLKDGVGTAATERDVAGNPKNLTFRPLEAAQLPRSLDDVDAAVINGNYAMDLNLNPSSDALVLEKAEGNPYVNGLVIAQGHESDPRVKTLVELLTGPEVKKYIEETFTGSVIPVS
ncbi:MetQ/NlpA family ABC transporter substrate-binding protein [Microbispora sp. NBC_01389]|uniref:MetQ/NlpA family ABC transporter substrate-binding protein n=1 Tax=Microbispora sp. NBC_01389 TaxID=2903584 RepID=UPI003252B3EC